MGASTPYGVFGNRHRLCLFLTPPNDNYVYFQPPWTAIMFISKLGILDGKKYHQKIWYMPISMFISNPPFLPSMSKSICHLTPIFFQSLNECSVGHNLIISVFHYSSVLNKSHVATFWNFDPNYSLPNVTQDSLPKKFLIVDMWLQISTGEFLKRK